MYVVAVRSFTRYRWFMFMRASTPVASCVRRIDSASLLSGLLRTQQVYASVMCHRFGTSSPSGIVVSCKNIVQNAFSMSAFTG